MPPLDHRIYSFRFLSLRLLRFVGFALFPITTCFGQWAAPGTAQNPIYVRPVPTPGVPYYPPVAPVVPRPQTTYYAPPQQAAPQYVPVPTQQDEQQRPNYKRYIKKPIIFTPLMPKRIKDA
jgi:hypothetical protein